MNARITSAIAAAALVVALGAADVFAAGGKMNRGGAQGGKGNKGACTQTGTQVRPEGSQRRDGTFLSTGVTANGSTVRPNNGRGVQDGTGVNAPAPATPVQ